jgi:ribonuclease I
MARSWLLLLTAVGHLLAASLVVSVPVLRDGIRSGVSDGDDWDYFLFVQTSPAGKCYFQRRNCDYPSNSTPWTIHGIWPTLNNTLGPNYCKKVTFSLSAIEDLVPQLIRQWTNVKTDSSLGSFWSHEWVKHGSCALGINAMSDEHSFFNTTLGLHEAMNFTLLLENQGIRPSYSHKYSTDDFNNAFQKTMGIQPLLECLYSRDMGQVLNQVAVCLRKDFSIMPCGPYVFSSSRTRCRDSETFLYVPKKTD